MIFLIMALAVADDIQVIDACEVAVRNRVAQLEACPDHPQLRQPIFGTPHAGPTAACSEAVRLGREVMATSDLPEVMMEGLRRNFYAHANACRQSHAPAPPAPKYDEKAECARSQRIWC